jgi:hypothetical protein
MANPTPGPWTRGADHEAFQLIGANGQKVLTIGFSDHRSWPDKAEAEANMRFVLAALSAFHEEA